MTKEPPPPNNRPGHGRRPNGKLMKGSSCLGSNKEPEPDPDESMRGSIRGGCGIFPPKKRRCSRTSLALGSAI